MAPTLLGESRAAASRACPARNHGQLRDGLRAAVGRAKPLRSFDVDDVDGIDRDGAAVLERDLRVASSLEALDNRLKLVLCGECFAIARGAAGCHVASPGVSARR